MHKKAFDKPQPFMVKKTTLNKLSTEETYLNIIFMLDKLTSNIILDEMLEASSLR